MCVCARARICVYIYPKLPFKALLNRMLFFKYYITLVPFIRIQKIVVCGSVFFVMFIKYIYNIIKKYIMILFNDFVFRKN